MVLDYYHATQVGLAALAGQLGAAYATPIIYVPLLMITHVAAFYLLLRPQHESAPRNQGGLPLCAGRLHARVRRQPGDRHP